MPWQIQECDNLIQDFHLQMVINKVTPEKRELPGVVSQFRTKMDDKPSFGVYFAI